MDDRRGAAFGAGRTSERAVSEAAQPQAEERRSQPVWDPDSSFWVPPGVDVSAVTRPRSRVATLLRERPLPLRRDRARLVELAGFAGIFGVLLLYLPPSLLLAPTTTTGGDTGAHIYAVSYMKDHLLPNLTATGWSPGWFAGFPIFHFYFPLGAALQALLSYVIGYEVAFKIGTVLGIFLLPLCVYALFRLMRFKFPVPLFGALFAISFLFMLSYTIYGGNIASTLAGEYAFTLSLALTFLAQGLLYRLATEGRGALPAAVTLAGATLAHIVPVMILMTLVPVFGFLAVRRRGLKAGALRLLSPLLVGFGLTAFWLVPFAARLGYTGEMRPFPLEGWSFFFPKELWIYLAAAALGCVLAVLRRDVRPLTFVVPALLSVLAFHVIGVGKIWNGRFLPFWYLGVFLCAAYFVGSVLPMVARAVWRSRLGLVTIVATLGLVLGISGAFAVNKKTSFVDDWATHNYDGYERKPPYATFRALMQRIAQLPPGRVMWEPSNNWTQFGTPVAMMTLPYFADHPSMEGMYFESSMLTPFHFLIAAELGQSPYNPVPDLPYRAFDIERGAEHLALVDARYYVTATELAKGAAGDSDRFEHIADVAEFSIFEVVDAAQVVVPEYEPVVLENEEWTDENVWWFNDPEALEVPLVADGPDGWERVNAFESNLPRRPVQGGGAEIDATTTNDTISFTTDAVGQPHWVKTSYFPNWEADGAEGPYLASPAMMMVVPTQPNVTLTYERTWAEWLGLLLTALSILVLALPFTRRRLEQALR